MGMGDRAFASATELSNEIRDRHIGCVELLDCYLARAERYNPALNAIPEIIGQNSGIKQIPNPAATIIWIQSSRSLRKPTWTANPSSRQRSFKWS
jgi:hypothetical protein